MLWFICNFARSDPGWPGQHLLLFIVLIDYGRTSCSIRFTSVSDPRLSFLADCVFFDFIFSLRVLTNNGMKYKHV